MIAPPPLLYIGAIAAGVLLERVVPPPALPAVLVRAGLPLAGAALVLMFAGFREFRRANTSFSTRDPSTAVIRSGPYAWSRNPLYIGLTGVTAGMGLAMDRAWVLAMLVPTLLVLHAGVIFREERYLERKFGDEYRAYRASVRRWFGRRKP